MIVDMLAIVAIGPDVEVAVAHRGQVIENQVAVTPESLASPVLVLLVKALFSCFDHYQRDRHYPGQDETELGRRHKAEIRSHRGKRKDSALSAAKTILARMKQNWAGGTKPKYVPTGVNGKTVPYPPPNGWLDCH